MYTESVLCLYVAEKWILMVGIPCLFYGAGLIAPPSIALRLNAGPGDGDWGNGDSTSALRRTHLSVMLCSLNPG